MSSLVGFSESWLRLIIGKYLDNDYIILCSFDIVYVSKSTNENTVQKTF